jgi:hypothetical protein
VVGDELARAGAEVDRRGKGEAFDHGVGLGRLNKLLKMTLSNYSGASFRAQRETCFPVKSPGCEM